MTESGSLDRIRALVAPIIADLKLDLYDLEFRGGVLRITVDALPNTETPDTETPGDAESGDEHSGVKGGVGTAEISLATRLISRDFDHPDPTPGHYTLEVTSPGLERTLRTPVHFQRVLGTTINVRLRDAVNSERRFQGQLVAADDHRITVRVEAASGRDTDTIERTVAYEQIDRARTVFVWGPAPKQSASKQPASKQPAGRAAAQRTEAT